MKVFWEQMIEFFILREPYKSLPTTLQNKANLNNLIILYINMYYG